MRTVAQFQEAIQMDRTAVPKPLGLAPAFYSGGELFGRPSLRAPHWYKRLNYSSAKILKSQTRVGLRILKCLKIIGDVPRMVSRS